MHLSYLILAFYIEIPMSIFPSSWSLWTTKPNNGRVILPSAFLIISHEIKTVSSCSLSNFFNCCLGETGTSICYQMDKSLNYL